MITGKPMQEITNNSLSDSKTIASETLCKLQISITTHHKSNA